MVSGKYARQKPQPDCATIRLRLEEGRGPNQWDVPHDSDRGTQHRAVSHAVETVHVVPRSAVISRTREEIKQRTNPHRGADGDEGWRIVVTTRDQDGSLRDTAGLPASFMAGRARCTH
jgi:hypothetical protein